MKNMTNQSPRAQFIALIEKRGAKSKDKNWWNNKNLFADFRCGTRYVYYMGDMDDERALYADALSLHRDNPAEFDKIFGNEIK